MLSASKQQKLAAAIKAYRKDYLEGGRKELDESGTRIMINRFLSDVLGYKQLEEIKTEYMIKGTYADYVIQVNKTRHFLVEVKALSFQLSEKHLRQTVNYGANEGIEYALLTNGRNFEFYKIIFAQPISSHLIFALDLSDAASIKTAVGNLQHLHKESVVKNSFKPLWNKCEATDPYNIAGILCSDAVLSCIRKMIKNRYDEKCDDEIILAAVHKIIADKMDPALIKPFKTVKARVKKEKVSIKVDDQFSASNSVVSE
ncbi:type I restriction and modification enzyme subunit R-like protein [Lacibacter cauensis]|uniref:Type I restriction and modification enzyme subunit R-like protein n=1 Tax=Lacibacter cauensis TaxID=510947 RepID=A0A562SBN4_9BACT|nr:type I restriction enzyme HsdR N-terminal domain-containing protein [Lacibacter cauensis]TWI78010.1 type I restriction and modification enzyme subunit R-like protein [Lacibacter cauensis]